MSSPSPADFYTGLVAAAYGPLRGERFDPAPYERFVRRCGEPALELGCGDGEPILDLVAAGLDVEGVDSSPDMLERCRATATARGLDVVVHLATMESMHLARRYRSIYLAGATFNLLPDDEVATSALVRIAAHLAPGGAALIPLFVPVPTTVDEIGSEREHVVDDRTTLRLTVTSATRDEVARTQVTGLRYERVVDAFVVESTERDWLLHWHTQESFGRLADGAGLAVVAVVSPDGGPADAAATSFSFVLTTP